MDGTGIPLLYAKLTCLRTHSTKCRQLWSELKSVSDFGMNIPLQWRVRDGFSPSSTLPKPVCSTMLNLGKKKCKCFLKRTNLSPWRNFIFAAKHIV